MLSKVIDQVADELAKVNNSNKITADFKFDKLDHHSLMLFGKFYNHLNQTIRKESDSPTAPTTAQTATPPFQTVVPPNLRHFSPSTESTSSRESTDEHFTQSTANAFLWATFDTIGVDKHCWWPKDYRLNHAEFPSSGVSLIMSREQKMKIRLGQSVECKKVTKVEARSDGGLNIHPTLNKCSFPLFGIEVYMSPRLDTDMRLNERNTACVILRRFIKGMPPRFMRKCWVKSVIKIFMRTT